MQAKRWGGQVGLEPAVDCPWEEGGGSTKRERKKFTGVI